MVQWQGVCYLQDPRFKVSRNTNATASLMFNCCSWKSRQFWEEGREKEEKEDEKIETYIHREKDNSSNI